MNVRVDQADEPDLWRALASPWRRRLLDLLRDGPATTGALASQLPELSRFAVMQHLGVLADAGASSLLALKRAAESGESAMSEPVDHIRTVRLAFELRIEASAQRTFEVMTQQSLDWFPHTYGEDRVRR